MRIRANCTIAVSLKFAERNSLCESRANSEFAIRSDSLSEIRSANFSESVNSLFALNSHSEFRSANLSGLTDSLVALNSLSESFAQRTRSGSERIGNSIYAMYTHSVLAAECIRRV